MALETRAGSLPRLPESRVEKWRGGQRLRFHFPLIEPDGRFSRIRLSDKDVVTGQSCLISGKLRGKDCSRSSPSVWYR